MNKASARSKNQEMSEEYWRRQVEDFVLSQMPVPARVLEVGCGDGYLASTLSRAGHSVIAIDPDAPEGAIYRRVKLEQLSDAGPFDFVVAVLALHHVEHLGLALDKIASLLASTGVLILVEFGWDRFDEQTARWALERLPEQANPQNETWVDRCCRDWMAEHRRLGLLMKVHCEQWSAAEGLHSAEAMLSELRRRFVERFFAWTPYLYPDLVATTEEDELRAIEQGLATSVGFRYVGEVRSSDFELR